MQEASEWAVIVLINSEVTDFELCLFSYFELPAV